jgi:hypothetical protein
MSSDNRWHFNPFDKERPLRQQEALPRSRSLNELREQQRQPVSVTLLFYFVQAIILDSCSWSTTF